MDGGSQDAIRGGDEFGRRTDNMRRPIGHFKTITSNGTKGRSIALNYRLLRDRLQGQRRTSQMLWSRGARHQMSGVPERAAKASSRLRSPGPRGTRDAL